MPRTRTAVRSAIINRAPHVLSPSGATWLATTPRCCIAHSAPWPRPFLMFLCTSIRIQAYVCSYAVIAAAVRVEGVVPNHELHYSTRIGAGGVHIYDISQTVHMQRGRQHIRTYSTLICIVVFMPILIAAAVRFEGVVPDHELHHST